MVIGAPRDPSGATGVDGDQNDASQPGAGAAYVFVRSGTAWSQQAYVKASNTRANALFGISVAISDDTLAVGSSGESSGATGVNGDQGDATAPEVGAVYVFTRTATASWTQQAYVKPDRNWLYARFGASVALSGDTLAVGAPAATYSTVSPGEIFVFTRNGTAWSQDAYLLGSTQSGAGCGWALALLGDTLAVGCPGVEEAYRFSYRFTTWSQDAHVKPSSSNMGFFGGSVALSGSMLAVGAHLDDSGATGINGDRGDASGGYSGAVYVF
jgi:hypothetical protein